MIHFLYYVYVGICSLHPHIALNKTNRLAATAPLTSNWPRLSPLVDVLIWVNDVYLKRRGADASIGSRFIESEPYAWHVVFLLLQWICCSLVKRPSIYTFPSFSPASWLHQESHLLHKFHIIHPTDCPRFAKPGPSCFSMVPDLVNLRPLPYKVQLLLFLR
jgi:hypothetical protein